MAIISRYEQLKLAIEVYRKALLPAVFDPTGTYPDASAEHLRAISFRLVVHGEIEAFLEDRSLEILDHAWKEWLTYRLPSNVIIGLLSYSEVATSFPPDKLGIAGNKKAYDDLHIVLEKAQAVWRYSHRNNNGIKESNVLALFLPLGISHTSLDSTLLADLSSYGSARGEVAHSSNATVSTCADPKIEFEKATKLVEQLKDLDHLVNLSKYKIDVIKGALHDEREHIEGDGI